MAQPGLAHRHGESKVGRSNRLAPILKMEKKENASVPRNVPIFWTIGVFDGVHLGHQDLLRTTVNLAQATGKVPGVLTFSPHPDVILKKKPIAWITTEKEREKILLDHGIEIIWTMKFTPDLARLSWKQFLEIEFFPYTNCAGLVVGSDFTFGKGAQGNAQLLQEYAEARGIPVEICPEVRCKGRKVSSSWIRECLQMGRVDVARMLMGKHFSIASRVLRGDQRGRKMGFPTLNLALVPDKILPKYGVYIVEARAEDFRLPGLCYVGERPTFSSSSSPVVEVFLDGEVGERYGESVMVLFCNFLREDRAFDSPKALENQMKKDLEEMRKYVRTQVR